MNRKYQDRGSLIDWTREATREQEVEATEKYAEGWLNENPDDVRVVAAGERLAKTGARAQDSERGDSRLVIAALAADCLAVDRIRPARLYDRSVDAAGRDVER